MVGPNLQWRCIRLSREDLANGKQLSLVDQFAELYQRMQAPADVAMFCSLPNGGNVDVYVTPATEKHPLGEMFIRVSGAEPCPRPADTLVLSVGHDEMRDRVRAGKI
jgi:hypothetical protein